MPEIEYPQGHQGWYKARRGTVTGSEWHRFIAPTTGKLRTGDMPKTYMAEKIAEVLGWQKDDFRGSPHITRGNELESTIRRWTAMELGQDIRDCSLFLSECGRWGSSPDGILEDGSALECKAPATNTFCRWMVDGGGLPDCHKIQCHSHLLSVGCDVCWFVGYPEHESLDPLLIKVERNNFTNQLGEHVESFCDDLDRLKREIITDPAYH